ncbi:carbohydrate-binding protein [Aestuariimicrobium soli]|uniref:carbohydrate-binding protein n=1 Tax=Aestuariimicrobium soli TaxID=2035834 RepID=UPI003EBE2388
MTIDYTTLTDSEVWELARDSAAEWQRRQVLATAAQVIREQQKAWAAAAGRTDGDPWVKPVGAVDVYPVGAIVTRDGKEWESLIDNNATMPGDPDDPQSYRWWRDLTPPPDPEPGEAPAWDGNGHAYTVDYLVTYEGRTYRCRQAHTSQPGWTPASVPALWEVQ